MQARRMRARSLPTRNKMRDPLGYPREDAASPRTKPAHGALATITAFLSQRPLWQKGTPFAVPVELYDAGRAEMTAIMKKRGYPLPQSCDYAGEHFLLFGTPITPKED